MSEIQTQKPTGKNNKSKVAIIVGVIVVIIMALFLVLTQTGNSSGSSFAGSGASTDYSLIPVSNDGEKWGYVNSRGEYAINPQFESADFFSSGLAKVKTGGKVGYINKKGEYVIPATYKSGTAFNDGLAFVISEGRFPACIDRKGDVKFELSAANRVWAFSEGMAAFVTESGEYGFVNKSGNVVVNAQFEQVSSFSGGFARVWQGGVVGFIDKTGRIVVTPQFTHVGNFTERKAPFYSGQQWGYIDASGAYAINPQFDEVDQFNEGMAVVRQGKMYGYINSEGKLLINPQFDEAYSFSEGLAPVRSGNRYGYIGKDGKFTINAQFDLAGDFRQGVAPVRSASKWGFINKKGQYVVNPQFNHINLERISDDRSDFVESDYYDTSEFIRLFFERDGGSTFDGVNASTTLEQLSEHPVYGADLNAVHESLAEYNRFIFLTDDAQIRKVTFHFHHTPIFTEYMGERRWNLDAKLCGIKYSFNLTGEAYAKRHLMISAMKGEIERRYGQAMRSEASVYFTLPISDRNFGYSIMGNNEFYVEFRSPLN